MSMKTIETDIIVSQDGQAKLDLKLSADVAPGRHRAVIVLDERPAPAISGGEDPMVDFPVHNDGPWPENLSLRRADLYGDDER